MCLCVYKHFIQYGCCHSKKLKPFSFKVPSEYYIDRAPQNQSTVILFYSQFVCGLNANLFHILFHTLRKMRIECMPLLSMSIGRMTDWLTFYMYSEFIFCWSIFLRFYVYLCPLLSFMSILYIHFCCDFN